MPFPSRIQGIEGKSDLVNEQFDVPLMKLGRKGSCFSSALCVSLRGHKEKITVNLSLQVQNLQTCGQD
jgi:hypothetical protein